MLYLSKERELRNHFLPWVFEAIIWIHLKNVETFLFFRFSLHAEQNNLAPVCQQLEAFLKTLPLKQTDPTSAEVETVKLTPDPTALESNSAHVALPYSVHYTSLALPAPYYTAPDFPA